VASQSATGFRQTAGAAFPKPDEETIVSKQPAQIEWNVMPPHTFGARAYRGLCAVAADLRDLAVVRIWLFRARYGL
jgi:hypothetical protein